MKRFLASLLLLLATLSAWAGGDITIGVFANRPPSVVENRWQPLAEYLTKTLPEHHFRLRVLDRQALDEAVKRDELDFVFTSPTHFIALRDTHTLSGVLATLINRENGQSTSSFGGVIVRRADRTDLQRLADLRGKTVASIGTNYLGAYISQMMELAQVDIARDQVRHQATGEPYDKAIYAVLAGEADAAFVRAGIVEQMTREGRLDPGAIGIINLQNSAGFPYIVSTALYPEWPFVALPRVDSRLARRVSTALLALARRTTQPPNRPALAASPFPPITPASRWPCAACASPPTTAPPLSPSPTSGPASVWPSS